MQEFVREVVTHLYCRRDDNLIEVDKHNLLASATWKYALKYANIYEANQQWNDQTVYDRR